MKVLFAGPSLHGAEVDLAGLDVRPPAAHGDVYRAVLDGAIAIGLVDGAFEAVAAVWHKEVLHALHEGVVVLGGASMGALRAAECAAYGMVPVGQVVQAYIEGRLDDDAAVAVLHGPVELGSPPLVEALVDREATIRAISESGEIPKAEADAAMSVARAMHYKDRTVERIAAVIRPSDPQSFVTIYRAARVSLKTLDAIEVVAKLRALPVARRGPQGRWQLNQPPMWRDAALRIERAVRRA